MAIKNIINNDRFNKIFNDSVAWYAKLLKQDSSRDCCCHFWATHCLQDILNEPFQYCSYCGRKLSALEFNKINKRQFSDEYFKQYKKYGVL